MANKRQISELNDALRVLKLEETRLRSAALACSCGLGTQAELVSAATHYGVAARRYKQIERMLGRVLLTTEDAEAVR